MSTSIHIPTASSNLTYAALTAAALTAAALTAAALTAAALVSVSVSLTNATLAVVISGGITDTPTALPIFWQLTDGELV
jgi:hypothetical protein